MAPTAIPAPEHGSELSDREGGIRSGRGDQNAAANRIAEMHPCLTKTSRRHCAQAVASMRR